MKKLISVVFICIFLGSIGIVSAANVATQPFPSVHQDGPPVQSIAVDFGVVGGYHYMRVVGKNVPVYDTPYGNILYRFKGGYDFVTPRNSEGSWTEINPGQWVLSRYLQEVYPSYFTGVVIQAEPAVPFGWILVKHYASSSAGGPEVRSADFLMKRYSVVNFYQAVNVDGMNWYDVGGGRWVKQTLVGKVQRVANPGLSGRWVAVDLYEQTLVAYEGNTMVFATLVSSGLPNSPTNAGIFQIWSRKANGAMSGLEAGYGNYRLENVPYAMYFDGDISLHGTYWHNRFGYRQSRGCVNLTITDAHWLYDWLPEHASVYVYYSGSY